MSYKIIVENGKEYITTECTIKMVERIKSFLSKQKKNKHECLMCKKEFKIESFYDLSEFYFAAIYCTVKHIEKIDYQENIFYYLFFIENFILNVILKDEEMLTVENVINERNKTEKVKNTIIKKSKEYLVDSTMHINCEQDIDSLSYKIFKHISTADKKLIDANEIKFILSLLLRRREFIRFTRVFSSSVKSLVGFRLFLLFSLYPDGEKPTNSIKNDLKNAKKITTDPFFINDDILNELDVTNHNEEKIIEEISRNQIIEVIKEMNLNLGYDQEWMPQEDWLNLKYIEIKWMDCVKLWFYNKDKSSECVNSSMIGICTKYRKYEEGWLIFNSMKEKYDSIIIKTCILSLAALKTTHCHLWIHRISTLIVLAIEKKIRGLCSSVAKEILIHLSDLDKEEKMKILETLMANISKYLNQSGDEFIYTLINGMSALCESSEDPSFNGCCFDYASSVYKWWKLNKNGCKNFKKQKELKGVIYSSMLSVCEKTNNTDEFCQVCKDLERSDLELDTQIFEQLEKYHNIRNCNCHLKDCDGRNKKNIKKLLKHVVKDKI